MECVNVTSMENGRFLCARAVKASITAFQEHKMKAGELDKFRDLCIQAGLNMECGPGDKTTKIPNVATHRSRRPGDHLQDRQG